MKDMETGNRLVFNGEIYNYKDFGALNDGQVILEAYSRHGTECLRHLRGMFALALWDRKKDRLFLAIDHAGIKPLYHWQGPDGTFLFASEIRALLATGLVPLKIDPCGLESYLAMGAVQAPHTIIEGMRAMLPGTYLTVSAEGDVSEPKTWWTPPFMRKDERGIKPEPEKIRDLLEDAILDHLVADVPVGLFLSGGMDSGVVAGIAAKHHPGIQAFSVTFPDWAGSEADVAVETARQHGLDWTRIPLAESDILPMIPEALAALDQPSFDGLNTYIIAKMARAAGLKCALSGMGGDEVFGGYSTFHQVSFMARWGGWMGFDPASGYLRCKGLFGARDRDALLPDAPPWEGEVMPQEMIRRLDPVDAVSLLEMRVYMANMLLRDTDCMSMAHGLEVRVPMLDRRLVEYMAHVPGRFKLNRFRHKPLLLDACRDLLLPATYQRPKGGFSFPWDRWLRGALRPMVEETLSDGTAFRVIGMEPQAVRGVWDAYLKGRLRWNHVWALVASRAWAHHHSPLSRCAVNYRQLKQAACNSVEDAQGSQPQKGGRRFLRPLKWAVFTPEIS